MRLSATADPDTPRLVHPRRERIHERSRVVPLRGLARRGHRRGPVQAIGGKSARLFGASAGLESRIAAAHRPCRGESYGACALRSLGSPFRKRELKRVRIMRRSGSEIRDLRIRRDPPTPQSRTPHGIRTRSAWSLHGLLTESALCPLPVRILSALCPYGLCTDNPHPVEASGLDDDGFDIHLVEVREHTEDSGKTLE